MKTCEYCNGNRYIVDRTTDVWARARVCKCSETCEKCEGRGQLVQTEKAKTVRGIKTEYAYLSPCECQLRSVRISCFNRARLPAKYPVTLKDFKILSDEHFKALSSIETITKRYRPDEPPRGLLITGPVGTGKTHLLVSTLGHLALEQGASVRYVESASLYTEIRFAISEGVNIYAVLAPLFDVDVLAIDELGKGRGSPFESDVLDELINRRYNSRRTTLFATNYAVLDEKQEESLQKNGRLAGNETLLVNKVGERVLSRLHEMCHVIKFPASCKDQRRRE